jgi:hypothetical protein
MTDSRVVKKRKKDVRVPFHVHVTFWLGFGFFVQTVYEVQAGLELPFYFFTSSNDC